MSSGSSPDAEEIRAQLERILAHRIFFRSNRISRFLRFSVEQTLAGNREEVKEQLIGIEVFDRRADYDPRIDPIVRVEARRLRSKLKAYYASAGRGEDVVIGLRKGTYAADFRSRGAAASPNRTGVALRAGPPENSIAVLPFANRAEGAEEDYFTDGLAEELIHLLTRIPGLRVIAWNSAAHLRGREQDLAGIRQDLKVSTILRGSVRRVPGRVRVTAQLIELATGAYLWSEAYDRKIENVFAIQEEMARAIVDALQLTLAAPCGELATRHIPNLACYDLCLEGRYHANRRTSEGLHKSVARFEEAIAADETCAEAHAGLADAYSLLADYGLLDPAQAMPRARSAAEAALRHDPNCAEANASLAFIRSIFEWKWAEAEALYRRAIRLNPGYGRARHWFGIDHLAFLGRFDEALAENRAAHLLDPFSLPIREGLGYIHILRREYPEAMRIFRELIDFDPGFYKGYSSMARALSLMGRYDEALEAFEKARSLAGALPSILAAVSQTLAAAGRRTEARAVLEELRISAQARWVPASSFAVAHLGFGEFQAALDHLEIAAEHHELQLGSLRVHPLYDPLRSEPRFARLLERVGLLP